MGKLKYLYQAFGLQDFFEKELTKKELKRLKEKGVEIKEPIRSGTFSIPQYLANMGGAVPNIEDLPLAHKIMNESIKHLIPEQETPEDLHFLYMSYIKHFYKYGDIESAKIWCMKMIEIGEQAAAYFKNEQPEFNLPSHLGYKQLLIICKNEKKWRELIQIAELGKKQGWTEDFDKRIEFAKKQLEKENK